ncbi:zinc dependent phospholipase C family protein [Halobacillus salinus]|nr:zinc dependent phospholipase C family protein [Halobacillus salinus]
MNTLHHGYWTFFATRKQKYVGWFIFGSILPDIIYYVMFLYLAVERNALQVLDDPNPLRSLFYMSFDLFDYPVVIILRQVGHSLFVWGMFFLIIFVWKGRGLSKWTALAYGWLGHVVIDILTHANDAVPMFYPISAYTFHSPISYWDDDHYAGIFNLINTTLILLSLLYLFLRWSYKKWKKKRPFTKSS